MTLAQVVLYHTRIIDGRKNWDLYYVIEEEIDKYLVSLGRKFSETIK